MLILGCGNPDRADDEAGILVARRLRELGIDAHECSGDMLALMDAWDDSDEVILVDAVASGGVPGAISAWDARKEPLPPQWFPCSTHTLGVAEVIELARALNHLPSTLMLYGIEAANFEPGGSPSPEILDAVERLAEDIAGSRHLVKMNCKPLVTARQGSKNRV